MAEDEPTPEQLAAIAAENEQVETCVNFQAPAKKTLQELHEMDKDDESLCKYKKTLLGSGPAEIDPSLPNVQVIRMCLVCDAPSPLTLDLQGDLEAFKTQSFILKESAEYKIKINFKVNREIVSGLKYVQETFRKGIRIDKSDYMVGSYGPRADEYDFVTPLEEAPHGVLARGQYNIKSKFIDDDKHVHLSWEWNLNIKKDWKD